MDDFLDEIIAESEARDPNFRARVDEALHRRDANRRGSARELEGLVEERLHLLRGPWVGRNSGYELDLAQALGMTYATSRYWDATWKDHLIEFKKGRSIWLDLVRYSEILLKTSADSARETTSLFFIPSANKDSVVEVLGADTSRLIDRLGITDDDARTLIELRNRVPRSLNAQASLTVSDIRAISAFQVRQ